MKAYEMEYGTCPTCHKYRGVWTDSGICSDCDEEEDERKKQVLIDEEEADEEEDAPE